MSGEMAGPTMSENKAKHKYDFEPDSEGRSATIALLSGIVRGQMRFPDNPNTKAEVAFTIWEEECMPFRTAIVDIQRSLGGLMIDFREGLGDCNSYYVHIGFDEENQGRVVLDVYRNDMLNESLILHPATNGIKKLSQQRVVQQKAGLDHNLKELKDLISGEVFAGLPAEEQGRLKRQYSIMEDLSTVLGERIAAFNPGS